LAKIFKTKKMITYKLYYGIRAVADNRQNANPSQNKKSCKPTHKPTQIAAHFILPNRTQAHPPPDFRAGDNLKGIFDRKAVLKLNFTDLNNTQK
jgi:hypothetical protein